MLGRASKMRKLGRHDPLQRQAKRLSDAERQRVETAVEEEVAAAVRTAMQSMETPS